MKSFFSNFYFASETENQCFEQNLQTITHFQCLSFCNQNHWKLVTEWLTTDFKLISSQLIIASKPHFSAHWEAFPTKPQLLSVLVLPKCWTPDNSFQAICFAFAEDFNKTNFLIVIRNHLKNHFNLVYYFIYYLIFTPVFHDNITSCVYTKRRAIQSVNFGSIFR